jgi:hypothetical protein
MVRTHTATFGLAYKFFDPILADTPGRTRVMPVKA